MEKFDESFLIPSEGFDIRKLGKIYDNTVATYKFYWFVSILEIVIKERCYKMSFEKIIIEMIADSWYPIHYFKLSFGKSDSLYEQSIKLQKILNIPIVASKNEIKQIIFSNLNNPIVKNVLDSFTAHVPYRFLSPWITYTTNPEVVNLSNLFSNNCMYRIKNKTIEINPQWIQCLNHNYTILKDFTFWNLTVFIQKRNPNVPDVSSKLVKPILRDSLTKQRNFWNAYFDITGSIQCIYTDKTLYKKEYELDHFVPWSFVSHNLLWNLLPADSSINSSKSNHLPSLDIYLKPFAKNHQMALKKLYLKKPNDKLFEDYLILHNSVSELCKFSEDDFFKVFKRTFYPMVQIAENMGFQYWNKKTEL